MNHQEWIDYLRSEKERVLAMGGEKNIAHQKARGKHTVRERLDLLFDRGRYTEIGSLVNHSGRVPRLKDRKLAADGLVTAFGDIAGNHSYVIAYDFTVNGGSMGLNAEKKARRIREIARQNPGPIIWVIDSAGARVEELGGSFFSTMGDLFQEQVELSGIVNQVCLVLGPGVAGTAYIPGLADCVIMTEKNSFLALAGPPLVKAAISEEVSEEELGGARVHNYHSGLSHFLAADDPEAIQICRNYISLVEGAGEENPVRANQKDEEPGYRDLPELDTCLPEDTNAPFEVKKIVAAITEEEPLYFQDTYGTSLRCAFARLDGFRVGILANDSSEFGGIITAEAGQKAARFIQICDSNGLPLVFLHDVPGFMVGSRVEKQGIIRDGSKFLFAMANATVPKLSVVLRKSFGAGYFVMCGRGFNPDLLVAWPQAQIALMGAEGAVNIVFRKEIEQHPEPEKFRAQILEKLNAEISSVRAAREFGVDEIIEPNQTRNILIAGLRASAGKLARREKRRRYIFPV